MCEVAPGSLSAPEFEKYGCLLFVAAAVVVVVVVVVRCFAVCCCLLLLLLVVVVAVVVCVVDGSLAAKLDVTFDCQNLVEAGEWLYNDKTVDTA